MITVIIPNYNGESIIKPCLDSLLKQADVSLEVIVIDNASIDCSLDIIRTYPFKLIENSTNVGFSAAVNQGILEAQNEYVFLLNSDVVLNEDTIKVLYKAILKDEKIFSVQPKMMQFHSRDLIDDAGDIYTPFGWAFPLGHGLPDNYHNKSRPTFSCCAGAALYRKEIFSQIGYFDESFFAYMEDVDIGYRALRQGFKNYYISETKVYHIGSASFGKSMTPLRATLSGRNNILTIRNNMPCSILLLNLPFILVGFLLKYFKFLKKGLGRDFFNGIEHGIKISKISGRTPRLNRNDFVIQLEMYINSIKFVTWKIRQIIRKRFTL